MDDMIFLQCDQLKKIYNLNISINLAYNLLKLIKKIYNLIISKI